MSVNYIEDRPSFSELVELWNAAEDLKHLVSGLAEGADIPQRATDLLSEAENFLSLVKKKVTEQ